MNRPPHLLGTLLFALAAIGASVGVSVTACTPPKKTWVLSEPNPTEWADERAAVPVSHEDPIWGSRFAPATIVVFSDFQCPYCSKVEGTLERLKETFGPDKLRIIWKHFPLAAHKKAQPAHDAAEVVFNLGGSEAFWSFHNAAFEHGSSLNPTDFPSWAASAGVSRDAFEKAFRSGQSTEAVREDVELGKRLGVRGTPSLFVNGLVHKDKSFEALSATIEAELTETKLLADRGTAREEIYTVRSLARAAASPGAGASSAAPDPASPDNLTKTTKASRFAIPVAGDPSRGAEGAKVTIVEFGDFDCPSTRAASAEVAALLKAHPEDVRLVWKNLPLRVHPHAFRAALAGEQRFADGGAESFFEAHDRWLALPSAEEASSQGGATRDPSWQFSAESSPAERAVTTDVLLADRLEVFATPTFFINGKRLTLLGKTTLTSAVEAELASPNAETAVPPDAYTEKVITLTPGSPRLGAADAKVELHVFGDFECPYSKRVVLPVHAIAERYESQIAVVWRDRPLVKHTAAKRLAGAAREALSQKGSAGFWSFHDALFAHQGEALDGASLTELAKEQGLDPAAFDAAMAGQKWSLAVDADETLANASEIKGTPGFVATFRAEGDGRARGYFVSGAGGFSKVQRVVRAALAKSNGLEP